MPKAPANSEAARSGKYFNGTPDDFVNDLHDNSGSRRIFPMPENVTKTPHTH